MGLSWAPREENSAADSSTDRNFELLDRKNRVPLTWEELKSIFTDLIKYVELGESFYGEVAKLKKRNAETKNWRPFKAKKVCNPW